MIAIFITFALLILVVIFSAFSMLLKNRRLNELHRVFRQYNDADQDTAILTTWIKAKNARDRLLRVLDYLYTLENTQIPVQILDQLDLSTLSDRQVQIFCAKAYLVENRAQETLAIVRPLIKAYPNDDAVLDITVDALITFGHPDEAKLLLEPRLEHKLKGTQFPKHYARIMAHEGNFEKAITIMRNVVNRDYMLATNTIAQPQKGLIQKQFEANQALLDQWTEQHEGHDPQKKKPE